MVESRIVKSASVHVDCDYYQQIVPKSQEGILKMFSLEQAAVWTERQKSIRV